MEFRHLRHFVAVAGELHFARAADRLVMEQPPLSQSIRNLEAELGVRLFQRTTRRTWLTRAGTRFLAETKRILRDIDAATVAVRKDNDGATGGIGLMASQMAAYAGAHVVATASGAKDEALVRANGAHTTLDYRETDPVAALLAIHLEGVNVVIDLINQFTALLRTAKAVRKGGALVSTLVGPDQAAFGDAEVHYIRLAPTARDLAEVVSAVEQKRLRPTISRSFPFADVPATYAKLRDGHVRSKIVVGVS